MKKTIISAFRTCAAVLLKPSWQLLFTIKGATRVVSVAVVGVDLHNRNATYKNESLIFALL